MTKKKVPARAKHFANIGDIIASLPALKTFRERTGRKIIFCQQINVPADYYAGAVHPVLDDSGSGQQVMCNRNMFEMVKPLLLSQEYIHDAEIYNGQLINIDLDLIRKERFANIPHQAIQQWLFMVFPDLARDLSKPWIEIGEVNVSNCYLIHPDLATEPLAIEDIEDKVIVNFTERYRNHVLNYFFLKKYHELLIFAGTEIEYLLFCKKWELKIPRLIVNDFLQLAYLIKKCKFLLSNQSFCWNLAEAMKTPRTLELCEYADNCQAFIGEHSYGYLIQSGATHSFKTLINKK